MAEQKVDMTIGRPSSRPSRAFRGYDRAGTDKLLGELESRRAELEGEVTSLRDHVARLEDDLARRREQEHVIAKTLIAATGHATVIKESARREAEQLLVKARSELEKRSARAEQVEREREKAEGELVRLRRLAEEMRTGLDSFLMQTLRQLHPESQPGAKPLESASVSLVGTLQGSLKQDDSVVRSGGEVMPSSPMR